MRSVAFPARLGGRAGKARSVLILRSIAIAGVACVNLATMRCISKDGAASCFETRSFGALLSMRPGAKIRFVRPPRRGKLRR
jgi:hypothetical protein